MAGRTLTESIVRRQIGAIHAYVLGATNHKYKTTTFSPVEDIELINSMREAGGKVIIENAYGLVGLYSFGEKYENVLAIYANGCVKEHVATGFPQYITLFVGELFSASLENLNMGTEDVDIQ